MAVGFDAKMTGGNGNLGNCQVVANTTSISSTGMTIGGSATLLVVTCTFGIAGTIRSPVVTNFAPTWNGTAMTLGPTVTTNDGTSSLQAYIAYLVNPATGNKTLAATWTSNADLYMGCASFTGTDTSTGVQASDNTTATGANNISITTDSSGATVAVVSNNNGKPTLSQTLIFTDDPNAPGGGATYAIGGTGTTNHAFTGGTVWALAGVHVIAAAAGGTIGHGQLLRDVRNRQLGILN